MSVSKDFEELLACFNAQNVKALVVGAYAVAFHAKPRFTKDFDLFVEPSRENAAPHPAGRARRTRSFP